MKNKKLQVENVSRGGGGKYISRKAIKESKDATKKTSNENVHARGIDQQIFEALKKFAA